MIRRLGIASAVASVVALTLAAPGVASAATTLGETFEPTTTFASGYTGLQAQSPGNLYAAPSPGVITSWSFQAAGASVPQGLKLKVAHLAGGTAFRIVGESSAKNPTASQLNTYTDVSIPVQTGDVIGLYMGSLNAKTYSERPTGSPFDEVEDNVDFAPGSDAHLYNGPFDIQLDVSAKVEADADHDGFGDETQDLCPSNAGTQDPCPVAPVTTVRKKKHCKHRKKHHSAESAKKKCGKKKKQKQ